MAINDDRTSGGDASRPSDPTRREIIRRLIEEYISGAFDKFNRQAASLRLEVNDLKAQLGDKDKEILAIREEIAYLKRNQDRITAAIGTFAAKELAKNEKALRSEKAYRKFFSGDSGLLYRLGHILSGFYQLSRKENPNANDMLKAYSPFINLANNLTVLDSDLAGIAQASISAGDIPVDELLGRLGAEEEERFYTALWEACEAPLRRLCDQTRDEEFDSPGAYDALMADVRQLLSALRSCDIAVIPAPAPGFDTLFDPSGMDTTPSRPLVMRASNSYVFTRGLYNDLKPYAPWE